MPVRKKSQESMEHLPKMMHAEAFDEYNPELQQHLFIKNVTIFPKPLSTL